MKALLAGLAATIAVTAQPVDRVRAGVMEAQQKMQRGQWDDARSQLAQVERECQGSARPKACSPLVDYAIGYLNQREAATAQADRRLALLRQANERYSRVIAADPQNAAVLNSQALVEEAMLGAGIPDEDRRRFAGNIETYWLQAIQSDPAHAARYRLALGNFLEAHNRAADALTQYRAAAAESPADEAPRRRILELSRGIAPGDQLDLCSSWEPQFGGLAAECYERLMARITAPGQTKVTDVQNEIVLLHWTTLVSRHDALNLDRLKALPRAWMAQAVDELRLYVEKPQANVTVWKWWFARPDRMAVAAEVSTTMGRQALNNPETGVQIAADCWEGLVRAQPQIAEEVASHEISRQPEPWGVVSVLRLYQELAALYLRNPRLDPDRAKLNRLVNEMFQGKAMAIAGNRPAVSQPFHMALAQIFAERGIWENGVAGATFQLEETLKDADRRLREEEFFQPLPEIKALLAQAYTKAAGRAVGAPAMYLQAAIAYLDTDALDRAEEMLGSAPRKAAAPLSRILESRRSPAEVASTMGPANTTWLFEANGAVTADFLARQRFKILADASSNGANEQRVSTSLAAYELVNSAHPVLVGTADVVRWKSVESSMLGSVNAAPSNWGVVPAGAPSATAIHLTIEGENRPLQIPVPADTKLAATVLRTIGVGRWMQVGRSFTLRQGQLSLTAPDAAGQQVVIQLRAAGVPVKI